LAVSLLWQWVPWLCRSFLTWCNPICQFLFLFPFLSPAALGFELRPSCLHGRLSATWATPPASSSNFLSNWSPIWKVIAYACVFQSFLCFPVVLAKFQILHEDLLELIF
jgi:hypothetical protein